jgi:hypothetical protein
MGTHHRAGGTGMSDTPETDYLENNLGKAAEMSHPVLWVFARKLESERDAAVRSCHIWQKGHSDIVAERDLWQLEAKRWRDMYLEYDEMLEGQVQEAVARLNNVWEDLDSLKKKVEDDLLD